ncbi:MAG: pyridoxamine 5'-phosphate oxidase family protein [Acidimicrobiales bacterium]
MRTIEAGERATMGTLDVDECLVLLRWEPIGRLAFADSGAAPIVVPVNFVVDGDSMVFRSGDSAKLDRLRERPASLQVDRFDLYRKVGWSVLVRGVTHEVTMDEDMSGLDLEPWAPGRRDHWVRLVPDAITGRRLQLTDGPIDRRGYL